MKSLYTLSTAVVFLFFCVLFFSCQKDISPENPPAPNPNNDLSLKIITSVSGFVTDENNLPVQNAAVNAGTKTATTDQYGYFKINNAELVKNSAFVTVNKPGYFKGIKTWIGTEGKSTFFRIKLLPKGNAGTVSGITGGDVTLAGGMKISFPVSAVVNATTNAAYSGLVKVSAQWLNPAAADLSSIMPGDLRGKDATDALKLLTTYGMVAVELTGTAGELLQIAPSKKATLTMPIPTAMIGAAPASIPLWYFDETNGLWKEEGSAVKMGNNYVGDVSHFSFWNYDAPANYVQLNCTVKDAAGNPLNGIFVKITDLSNNASATGYTDNTGYVAGAIPLNAQLKLEIFSNPYSCTIAAYTQNFSSSNTNISLGVITLSVSQAASVTGSVTNCSGSPVTNGRALINVNGLWYEAVTNSSGNYSVGIILCGTNASATIRGEDFATNLTGNPLTVNINLGNNAIPPVQACGNNITEFVYYTINGTSYNYSAPANSLYYYYFSTWSPPAIHINAQSTTGQSTIKMEAAGIAAGSNQNLIAFRPLQIQDSVNIFTPIGINITEYGSVGQYVAGGFNGTLTGAPPSNTPYIVNCTFRIKRTN